MVNKFSYQQFRAGDHFGDIEAICSCPREHTAQAKLRTSLLVLSSDQLAEIKNYFPNIYSNMTADVQSKRRVARKNRRKRFIKSTMQAPVKGTVTTQLEDIIDEEGKLDIGELGKSVETLRLQLQ
jgi:CRP-like cAMP-binding protein